MNKAIPTALYVKTFLPISETFIYNPLAGVRPDFSPAVICKFTKNRELYPFDPVFCRNDLLEKTYYQARRGVLGYNDAASPANYEYWAKSLKNHGAKLIHTHFGPNGITMIPLAEKTGLPLIVTLHGFDVSKMLDNERYVRQLGELFKETARILVISERFKKEVIELGCPEEKIERQYCGIPVDRFAYKERKTKPGETLTALQVSSFTGKKGHQYTIGAFKKVRDAGINCRLVLVGDGPTREAVEEKAKDLDLLDYVEFAGKKTTKEIPSYVDRADIFVHHSITTRDGNTEGIPNAIMEAMASGLPVLSTIHAGIPELVIDGKSGFLVKERDIDAYADKWIELSANQEMRTEFGRFNRERVEEYFNLSKQIESLKNTYREVIE